MTWMVCETSCLLLLVALCLTGLGLGDSHLVILSLYSLIIFFFLFPYNFSGLLCALFA